MIFVTVLTCFIYGGREMKTHGSQMSGVDTFNPKTWSTAIGFSVYFFEGIGVVLPINEITAKPESYWKVVIAVLVTTATISVFFGLYCCFAWGDKLDSPLITD